MYVCCILSLDVMPKRSLLIFQINLGIYLQDDSTEFSVLVDRSVGGSSIIDGELELMLHRFASFSLFHLPTLLSGFFF